MATKAETEKIQPIYQLLFGTPDSSLPPEWSRVDFTSFSRNISLYDYQQDALKCATYLLYHYFHSLLPYDPKESLDANLERKRRLYNEILPHNQKLIESLGIRRTHKLFKRIAPYYLKSIDNERIPFQYFVNRMGFWMATGSGKTLVLIKLIELLDRLKGASLIPNNDILVMTSRDDLIEQLKNFVDEFNTMTRKKIMLWNLNEYDEVKRSKSLLFPEAMHVFVYRSDLISEETKEKQLSFEQVENDGRWYVLLDEAHKGDKEDSKRQLFYSVLSRNGFLFNFSATFTDPWDIVTTVYNYNLSVFIQSGYGKNIYLSQQELSAFKEKEDFNRRDKQKIVLKSFVFLCLSKLAKLNVDEVWEGKHYHNPLLVALVNEVNVEHSDLELFFRELERIARGEVDEKLLEEAKEDLLRELRENRQYTIGNGHLEIDKEYISKIGIKEIHRYVYNAEGPGNIEVIQFPGNKQDLVFKLKSSEKPFALIRIGDISTWLKDKLEGYEISSAYESKDVFAEASKSDSPVNILMGSRAFYEGWDTNRPNVIVFINIGTQDAKKYVTQSIGRGVRIEPIQNKRKRLQALATASDDVGETARRMLSKLGTDVSLLETLFVLGTSKKNIQDILEGIRYEKQASGEIISLERSKEAEGKELLIPVYKDKPLPVIEEIPQFKGNRDLLSKFVTWLNDDRVFLALFSDDIRLTPKMIERVKEFLAKGKFENHTGQDLFFQMSNLFRHVAVTLQDLDRFKALENEIVHFERISAILEKEKLEELKEKINRVKSQGNVSRQDLMNELKSGKISVEEYTRRIEDLTENKEVDFAAEGARLRIKNIAHHYYIPVILSEDERIRYITHILTVPSEIRFVEQLERLTNDDNSPLKQFEWWMFSKLDEHLDSVYIPYYNRLRNELNKFKPDFIFWLKKQNNYSIVFIDPKGTAYTDYEFKEDGFARIFVGNGKKVFPQNGLNIRVYLYFFTEDRNKISDKNREYWIDNMTLGQVLLEIANDMSA